MKAHPWVHPFASRLTSPFKASWESVNPKVLSSFLFPMQPKLLASLASLGAFLPGWPAPPPPNPSQEPSLDSLVVTLPPAPSRTGLLHTSDLPSLWKMPAIILALLGWVSFKLAIVSTNVWPLQTYSQPTLTIGGRMALKPWCLSLCSLPKCQGTPVLCPAFSNAPSTAPSLWNHYSAPFHLLYRTGKSH